MPLGYRIEPHNSLPVIMVKLTFPPRPDVERMFAEVASGVNHYLDGMARRIYRVNDFTVFNGIPIFSQVIRGLAAETMGRPGTNSDPRLYPVMVGKGSNVRLIVEALREERYGRWNVPAFATLDEALDQIRRWEAGEEQRPDERLPKQQPADSSSVVHTLI